MPGALQARAMGAAAVAAVVAAAWTQLLWGSPYVAVAVLKAVAFIVLSIVALILGAVLALKPLPTTAPAAAAAPVTETKEELVEAGRAAPVRFTQYSLVLLQAALVQRRRPERPAARAVAEAGVEEAAEEEKAAALAEGLPEATR